MAMLMVPPPGLAWSSGTRTVAHWSPLPHSPQSAGATTNGADVGVAGAVGEAAGVAVARGAAPSPSPQAVSASASSATTGSSSGAKAFVFSAIPPVP